MEDFTPSYTPEDFKKKVMTYHRECEEVRLVFPDEAGLLNYLDITDEEYDELKKNPDYSGSIRWARRRRTSWLERMMVTGQKGAVGCMNALKQEKNGGYADKPEGPRERKIIVKMEGVTEIGGKELKK